jgi:hypothetical protein
MQWINTVKQYSIKLAFVAYEPSIKTAAINGCVPSVTESSSAGTPLLQITSPSDMTMWWCDILLQHGFGAIFDMSVGSHGCPFVNIGRHTGCM